MGLGSGGYGSSGGGGSWGGGNWGGGGAGGSGGGYNTWQGTSGGAGAGQDGYGGWGSGNYPSSQSPYNGGSSGHTGGGGMGAPTGSTDPSTWNYYTGQNIPNPWTSGSDYYGGGAGQWNAYTDPNMWGQGGGASGYLGGDGRWTGYYNQGSHNPHPRPPQGGGAPPAPTGQPSQPPTPPAPSVQTNPSTGQPYQQAQSQQGETPEQAYQRTFGVPPSSDPAVRARQLSPFNSTNQSGLGLMNAFSNLYQKQYGSAPVDAGNYNELGGGVPAGVDQNAVAQSLLNYVNSQYGGNTTAAFGQSHSQPLADLANYFQQLKKNGGTFDPNWWQHQKSGIGGTGIITGTPKQPVGTKSTPTNNEY